MGAKQHGARRFVLQRIEDVGGISGVGTVAEGCLFSNGYVAMTWLTHLSTFAWYHSIDVLLKIHGHDGRTKVVFTDEES